MHNNVRVTQYSPCLNSIQIQTVHISGSAGLIVESDKVMPGVVADLDAEGNVVVTEWYSSIGTLLFHCTPCRQRLTLGNATKLQLQPQLNEANCAWASDPESEDKREPREILWPLLCQRPRATA